MIDVTLDAGDVLWLCPMWVHVVENTTPFVSGISTRMIGNFKNRLSSVYNLKIFFKNIFRGLITKINNPKVFTIVDYISASEGFFDFDQRFQRTSSLNELKN